MNKLLIVGTVAFDAIETPFGKTDKILGGSAPYIGLSASQFGTASAIVSVVGGDFPETHLELLRQHNIDISGIEIISSGKTFFWSGRYHNDMNTRDTLSTELNVLSDFQPVVPSKFKDANVVVLGNLHPLVQSSVLDQVTNKEALVILDTMNFWMDNTLEDLMEVIKRVDVITINDEEARQLSGQSSLVAAARNIHEMGPKHVVIKKENTAHYYLAATMCFLHLHFHLRRFLILRELVSLLLAGLQDFCPKQTTLLSKT